MSPGRVRWVNLENTTVIPTHRLQGSEEGLGQVLRREDLGEGHRPVALGRRAQLVVATVYSFRKIPVETQNHSNPEITVRDSLEEGLGLAVVDVLVCSLHGLVTLVEHVAVPAGTGFFGFDPIDFENHL